MKQYYLLTLNLPEQTTLVPFVLEHELPENSDISDLLQAAVDNKTLAPEEEKFVTNVKGINKQVYNHYKNIHNARNATQRPADDDNSPF